MIKLSSEDASLLVDVLESDDLTNDQRLRMLEGASSDEVKQIGSALIGASEPPNDAIKQAVQAIKDWAEESRRVTRNRLAHYV
jgi:hypothetical protein